MEAKSKNVAQQKISEKEITVANWWKPVVLAALLGALGWFGGYGYTYRPLIDYGLTAQGTWTFSQPSYTQQFPSTLSAYIDLGNRGSTDGEVHIDIAATNATISFKHDGPFGTTLNESLRVLAGTKDSLALLFYVKPDINAVSFLIYCSGGRVTDYSSFSSIISTFFAEIKPFESTTLNYVRNTDNSFSLET